MLFLDYFKQISTIPHCSANSVKLADFLFEFAKKQGFDVKIDEFGNIYAIKGNPKICLQAHYDMVCVGNAPNIALQDDGEFLFSTNSTIGADNGIGVSIIMQMMKECKSLEVLFTNDEEIGLIGANGFNGDIVSANLLNLDSERDDEVIIGCAGGFNAKLSTNLEYEKILSKNIYEIKCEGLQGGHSGIEIAKNIPNAIKKLTFYMLDNNLDLIQIQAGDRNNAIPTFARSIVCSDDELKSTKYIQVNKLDNFNINENFRIKNSQKIINLLSCLCNGVLAWDNELNMPLTSINLAIVKQNQNKLSIDLFARSSDENELDMLKNTLCAYANLANFKSEFSEHSLPWKPNKNEFSQKILEILQEYNPKAKLNAIHAGLECGVLQAKMLKKGKILHTCSIGPNISGAHTINERCDINSAKLICNIVAKILTIY